MDISLRQLEAFIKVAEHRSFSKAGDELFYEEADRILYGKATWRSWNSRFR